MTTLSVATRAEKKAFFRAEVRADFKSRFPRLKEPRLTFLVNQKADMMLADAERADALERKQAYLQEDVPAGLESSPFNGVDLGISGESKTHEE